MLDGWGAQVRAKVGHSLAAVLDSVQMGGAPAAVEFDRAAVIGAAVAAVEASRSAWSRFDLIAELDRALPAGVALPDGAVALLDALADEASSGASGVVSLTPPAAVEVPAELRREDGHSVYEPRRPERYATESQVRREEGLLAVAAEAGAVAVALESVAAVLGPLGLGADQAEAVSGVAGSGRYLDVLIGPAGAGKSRALGALSDVWRQEVGGRVVGLSLAENAALVLAGEGVSASFNVARFLRAHRDLDRGRRDRHGVALDSRSLVVVDEASMVPTALLSEVVGRARAAGAKVLLTGDDAQLSAPGAGGALSLLVSEGRAFGLSEVRRFAAEWEAGASLRLREGDASVLAEYDRRGRLLDGDRASMEAAAVRGLVADLLGGPSRPCLVVPTNEQAAAVSSEARAELVRLGLVGATGVPPFGGHGCRCGGSRAGACERDGGVGRRRSMRREPRGLPCSGGVLGRQFARRAG